LEREALALLQAALSGLPSEETDLLLYFQVSALLAVAVAPTTTEQALLQLVKMAGLVVVALSSTEHLLVLEQVAQVV
jgi:hypothetical protein